MMMMWKWNQENVYQQGDLVWVINHTWDWSYCQNNNNNNKTMKSTTTTIIIWTYYTAKANNIIKYY